MVETTRERVRRQAGNGFRLDRESCHGDLRPGRGAVQSRVHCRFAPEFSLNSIPGIRLDSVGGRWVSLLGAWMIGQSPTLTSTAFLERRRGGGHRIAMLHEPLVNTFDAPRDLSLRSQIVTLKLLPPPGWAGTWNMKTLM